MPAIVADPLLVPRLEVPAGGVARPLLKVVTAPTTVEGEGFQVRRPFPNVDLDLADPFLLLDHLGAVEYAPGEAKGAPDHPHRGFETVTYIIDGAVEHKDSTGGGGLIADGATQWMTAGAGIVHSELPPAELVAKGGLFHGVQLWVNLPRSQKWTPPRYQDIGPGAVSLLSSADGGALVRLIAGDLGGHSGPGNTRTPITYAHSTLSPGARLDAPWRPDFNAMVYVLAGHGAVGPAATPIGEGQLAVLGFGDRVVVEADPRQPTSTPTMEVLLLGGRPILEPVVRYGPFVMNSRHEILEAIADYQSGRMGSIPASRL
ncbi:MAG: pirin family protein [Actinomycetota bacterium]|nr:pirin family protein [Actinomycetota bacterium]